MELESQRSTTPFLDDRQWAEPYARHLCRAGASSHRPGTGDHYFC